VVDYDLPIFGAVRNWTVVAIGKSYPGQARQVAQAVWGYAPLMFSRLLVIVDAEVDLRDTVSVLRAVSQWCDPGRDLIVADGPADPWLVDPQRIGVTHRLAIDATRKLPGETRGSDRVPAEMTASVRRLVDDRWLEYGLGPMR
jgi:4-hydroxy-3-polyprenylbenzoate decarboxylase